MSNKVTRYKVWIHTEGLNEDGDTIEGDDHLPPIQVGHFGARIGAIKLRDYLEVISEAVKYIGGIPDDED